MEHKHNCCCGNHDNTEHQHDCAGHEHTDHTHSHDCGCEHHVNSIDELSQNETNFLHELLRRKHLPIASFITKSSTNGHFELAALKPVFIRSLGDTMDEVKEAGGFLELLENKGLITLDYDIPLDGYSYDEYKNCDLFSFYCNTVKESGQSFDLPTLECGSMALTENAMTLLQK